MIKEFALFLKLPTSAKQKHHPLCVCARERMHTRACAVGCAYANGKTAAQLEMSQLINVLLHADQDALKFMGGDDPILRILAAWVQAFAGACPLLLTCISGVPTLSCNHAYAGSGTRGQHRAPVALLVQGVWAHAIQVDVGLHSASVALLAQDSQAHAIRVNAMSRHRTCVAVLAQDVKHMPLKWMWPVWIGTRCSNLDVI
eukprot:997641-Pelagomonas_calceolata.AAC.3